MTLVRDTLVDNGYDVHGAVSMILHLMANSNSSRGPSRQNSYQSGEMNLSITLELLPVRYRSGGMAEWSKAPGSLRGRF